jgi:hypothetical protein
VRSSARLDRLEKLISSLPGRGHQAPGMVLYDVTWDGTTPATPDTPTLTLHWGDEGSAQVPWEALRRCSCGTVGCARMEGLTIFLPRKGSMADGIPRPRHEQGDGGAEEEIGADELRQLADLRDQVARLQTSRREG